MAIIKRRGSILHIQWYDSIEKKVKTKSTGLVFSRINIRKAKIFANKLQTELTANIKKIRRN